ncbi:hypothetical protein Trydic_g14823 [Trypoxylus dichotomus]
MFSICYVQHSLKIAITPTTLEEQELRDALKGIIVKAQEHASLAFETDITLAFEDLTGSHESQFVKTISEYDEDYEHADEGGGYYW